MTRLDRAAVMGAIPLSLLAGYVDALGFIDLGGFFVSFMSGNSTRLGIGLGRGQGEAVVTVLVIVFLFVLGVVMGSLAAERAGDRRREVIYGLVAGLLGVAAVLHSALHVRLGTAAMVLAMGAENTILRRDGVSVGLTYMTGNLVKMGHAIADAMRGGDRWGWAPFMVLWVALVVGGTLGTLAHRVFDMNGLWIAAGLAGVMAVSQRAKGEEAA